MNTETLTIDPLLDIKQVLNRVNMCKSTMYKLIDKDEFPKPVKPTPRMSRWRQSDINAWINSLGSGNGTQK